MLSEAIRSKVTRTAWSLAILLAVVPSHAKEPMSLTTEEDHALMMKLLGIKTLRSGANGMDPKAPNAANYEETKANPFPKLPDPLVTKGGKPVTTAQDWLEIRRPEIVEDFDREVYGRVPKKMPRVTWVVKKSVMGKKGDVPILTRELIGHVDNSDCPAISVNIEATLITPRNVKD